MQLAGVFYPAFNPLCFFNWILLCDHLLLYVGPSNGKNSSSFLRSDPWVNSLIVIPTVDLRDGASKGVLANSGTHTGKVDFPVMQNSALCLLLCFCMVEEHKPKWEEKIKGNTFLLFTLSTVCKNTLCFYGVPQRFTAKATSGTFHHLQRACWGVMVLGCLW